MTLPFFTFFENARVTLPTEQLACFIAVSALASLMPLRWGTTQLAGRPTVLKVAVTEISWSSVRLQVLVSEQLPPAQPAKIEPAEAVAVRVTLEAVAKNVEHAVP